MSNNASVFHDAALQQRQLEALKQKQQQQQQREPDVQNAPEQQQQQQSDVAPAATIDTLIEDLKAFEHEFLNDDFNIDSSGKPTVPSDDLGAAGENVIMEEGDGHAGEFILAYEVVQDNEDDEDEAPTTNHQNNVSRDELREVTLAQESGPVENDDEMENEVLVVTLDHDADEVAENERVESHAMDSESRKEVIIPETEGVEDLPANEIQDHRKKHTSTNDSNGEIREILITNDSHDAVTSQDETGREMATQYFTPTATVDVTVQNSEDVGEPYEVIEDSEDDEGGSPLQDDTTKANAISPIENESAGQDEAEKTDRVEDVVDDSDNDNEGEETPAPATIHFFETQPQSDLALESDNNKNEAELHIPTTQATTTTQSSSDPTKETKLNPDSSLTSEGNLMEAFTSTQLSPHSRHQHKHLEDQNFFATSPILPRQTQSTDSPSGWTAFNPSGRVVSLEPGVTQSQYSEFEFTPTGDEESGGLEEDEGNDEKRVEADREVEVEVEEDEEEEDEEEKEVPLKKRVRIEEDSQTQKPWIVVPDSCVQDEIYESQEDVDGENVQEDEGEEMEVDVADGLEEESEDDEELVLEVEEADELPCDFVLGGVKVYHSQYRPPNVFSLSEIVSEAFGRLCE
ncbi:hypothetical protein HDU79_000408 [Rhizoclosmatium sp. JEL0117]|nr:hypothetical protein HDU79_000408 [Rhizoclosmatium sp. JEL0117]